MKILFLSHNFYPDIGGIEINSDILAQSFSEVGHDVHLLTWSKDSSNKKFPYLVIRNPSKRKLFAEHYWADLVFENNPCLRLAWPNLFFRNPSVIVLNTWITRINGKIGFQDRLKLLWLKHANKVIAVSDAVRKRCWPSATVIANPYRSDQFKIIPGIKKTIDFVFLGRLVSDKGADHAIKAIHQLISSNYKSAFLKEKPLFTIIGSGPEYRNLQQLISELEMELYIKLVGPLSGEELAICLNRHRFLLVPSLWEEPFGNVVLEAMACGCIPIVSDGGGLPDAIGNAGMKFQRGDIDSLVNTIVEIVNNPSLELKLKNEAITHLTSHRPDVVASKYLNVVESALHLIKPRNESTYITSHR
ncbi:glycosyltransferase family 4 protein [Mucilaginibacter arboris]|uniref:glycosyltransferase family 4 protein n=1 Tax=Mucilaginibacter arboris TaxID=2682090 RepID=UPI0012FC6A89|nr:glycosyltransferase family 4 protein [Mucilaginibacter arboris]